MKSAERWRQGSDGNDDSLSQRRWNRNTEGLVTPRHYKIIVKCTLFDSVTEKVRNVKLTLEGYPAIVFQHEYDHLNGILYIDRGDKDFAEKTTAQFKKRAERAAQKRAEKEAKARKIAAKLAAKESKKNK